MSLAHAIRQALSQPFSLPLYESRSRFLRMFLSAAITQVTVELGLTDPLTRLASKYKSDKGITVFPFNGYTPHYHALFGGFRNQPINVLEIGLARWGDRNGLNVSCPSLSIWVDYFRQAQIYGFDIDDFSAVILPRTQIFRGDQGNVGDLSRVTAWCQRFDIIIDDGSHASYHQQVTLKTLFPHLASHGLYVIEDLNFQPAELEATLPPARKTVELLKDRSALEELLGGAACAVQFFDSPVPGGEDTLAVLTRPS